MRLLGWTPPRPGLRNRVALALGLLSLMLSLVLASVVWAMVSSYLLDQRERTAQRQARVNVESLSRALDDGGADIPHLLATLPATQGTTVLLSVRGEWYSRTLEADPDILPAQLRSMVLDGTGASQRIEVRGQPFLAVGLPVPDGAYFELFPLSELDTTLSALSVTLAGAAAVTALVGAIVGHAASRQAFAPLVPVTEAASSIARGDLATRLDAGDDPDLKVLAESFNRTAERLERRVAADARFAGDVSHELRTPLTTIVNSMELLIAHRTELSARMQEPLDLLAVELKRLARMIDELLEISRTEDSGVSLVLESVLVGELVRRAADRAAGRPVSQISAAAERLRVRVDKRRLEQVVTNLVDNAETHGGGLLRVAVEASPAGAHIFVDDCGPGVAPERRERIFERFARAPGVDGDGVGLGLAIVARHVQLHGGEVCVRDRPGGGARFVVEIPGEKP